MESMGVRRNPGMAADLMRDFAPLLADEGIDLDNLSVNDIDTVNAALARATERYNLELFTPTGKRRTQALAVLRDFIDQIRTGELDDALDALASIPSDPTPDQPSVAHVIGAGLGLLDTWYTDPNVGVPHMKADVIQGDPLSEAGWDILVQARQGQAFDSIGPLIMKYGGLAMLQGTALNVADVIYGIADVRGMSVKGVANQLLTDAKQTPARPRNDHAKHGKKQKKNHQPSEELSPQDRAAVRDFRDWLRDDPSSSVDEARLFQEIVLYARSLGIDPHTPSGIEDLIGPVLDFDDPETILTSLVVLSDYARFRLERDKDDAWDAAGQSVMFMFQSVQTRMALSEVNQAGLQLDPDERRRAYAATRIVAKVPELLEWLREGRKVAVSGALRRADIAEVAAMLGIAAVGTNKRPAPSDDPTIYALSMHDVPVLAAWWEALQITAIIETQSDRVYPGPLAAHWLDEPLPPLELTELLMGMFIIAALGDAPAKTSDAEDEAMGFILANLMHAVYPDSALQPDARPDPAVVSIAMPKLRQLEHAGLLQIDPSGAVTVPPMLRGVVAHALLVTLDGPDDDD